MGEHAGRLGMSALAPGLYVVRLEAGGGSLARTLYSPLPFASGARWRMPGWYKPDRVLENTAVGRGERQKADELINLFVNMIDGDVSEALRYAGV